jgi:hypothetical protein
MTRSSLSEKRYLLVPGYVTSANDGQRHFVSGAQLASLYGVSLSECHTHRGVSEPREKEKLTILRPRADGQYRLPS